MNGPIKMYQSRKIIRHDTPVELPNCMYKMKNILSDHKIHSDHSGDGDHVSSAKKNLEISEQVNNLLKKYETHPEMAELKIRQENILKQLAELKNQMLSLRSTLKVTTTTTTNFTCNVTPSIVSKEVEETADLVINVCPANPPYSLLVLQKLWTNSLRLVIQSHVHSTVVSSTKAAQEFEAQIKNDETNLNVPKLLVHLIWKDVDGNMELITSSSLNLPIHGESNILRYLSRIGPTNWNYETLNNSTEIDSALDICYSLSRSRTKTDRASLLVSLNAKLGKSQFLCGSNKMSIADVAACSVIRQIAGDVNVNLTKWMQRCEKVN